MPVIITKYHHLLIPMKCICCKSNSDPSVFKQVMTEQGSYLMEAYVIVSSFEEAEVGGRKERNIDDMRCLFFFPSKKTNVCNKIQNRQAMIYVFRDTDNCLLSITLQDVEEKNYGILIIFMITFLLDVKNLKTGKQSSFSLSEENRLNQGKVLHDHRMIR